MSNIARDYQSAVALISASPNAHFTVHADGGISKESRIKAFFGHRDVEHRKMDAKVGEALVTMYEQARTQAAGAQALVEPHQLEVVARFIRAYDQARAAAGHADQAATEGVFGGRSPSIPAQGPTDAGSKHRLALQKILAANGLRPAGMVDYVQRLQQAASGFSPEALHRFNRFALGGGNTIFRVLFNHPECTDPSVSAEERHTRYKACARPHIEATKAELMRGKDAFLQLRMDQEFTAEEAQAYWEEYVLSINATMELNATLDYQLDNIGDCLVELGAYIAAAKQNGLTQDQAMTPIRLWMSAGKTDTLDAIWQANPDLAPPLAELGLVARLIEQEIPLSNNQALLAMDYFPGASS